MTRYVYRSLTWLPSTITVCSDGTTCENSSTCLAHPTKEGSYLCDCQASPLSTSSGPFAGLYCEFAATSLCSDASHAFCTNGGECKQFVGQHSQHLGCKCPRGYAGDYCQFLEGGVPTDWETVNYPTLAAARAGVYDEGGGRLAGIVMGTLMAVVFLGVLSMLIVTGKLVLAIPSFKRKQMDTSPDAEHDEFVGGKSVYIKRRSTKSATFLATAEMLEADGAVLTDAMAEITDGEEPAAGVGGSPTKGGAVGLREVDLDDLASSLDQDHKVEDLPDIA